MRKGFGRVVPRGDDRWFFKFKRDFAGEGGAEGMETCVRK